MQPSSGVVTSSFSTLHSQDTIKHQRLYSKTGANAIQWNSGTYPPNNTALIWYRTEFNAPKGNNAVALDLTTMSKGQAWVNGHHIGCYFPSFKAPTDGCSDTCDYRGTYSPTNCVSSCGKSSQEWYHVPRSWLHPTNNVLVLLEEIGGDSSRIGDDPSRDRKEVAAEEEP
ncbi:hypothetical protein SUGI_0335490 [Cryptomeria japonica]|nr:hypothetical protein SUGI_0335490 [Cryptomeria japonica]